jgi:beta-phosphoglucomutase-like phosphatase (HAD superfamily)
MLPGLPLRPGVHRFMRELRDRDIPMGVCTTSTERVAETVTKQILADIPFAVMIAGDMVKRKKPDPEIYLTALERLGVPAPQCLVVEDSCIGVQAAKDAGCLVLATYNSYTENEDLSRADAIVSCLGDPDGEKAVVKKETFPLTTGGIVSAENLPFLKNEPQKSNWKA